MARRIAPHFALLITGGLGDFMAIEAFMPPGLRNQLVAIYYATHAAKSIQTAFAVMDTFPLLKSHVVLWNDFSKFYAFNHKGEVDKRMQEAGLPLPDGWRHHVGDWSIAHIFPQVSAGLLPYEGSSLLSRTVAVRPPVPAFYYAISPATVTDKRNNTRDFDRDDWAAVLARLERDAVPGVVLGIGDDPVPEHPLLVNLVNKTTLPESVEVLKGAKGFFGIDSSMSVLAAKLFDRPNLQVKTRHSQLVRTGHIYYAPKTDMSFIRSRMEIDG